MILRKAPFRITKIKFPAAHRRRIRITVLSWGISPCRSKPANPCNTQLLLWILFGQALSVRTNLLTIQIRMD